MGAILLAGLGATPQRGGAGVELLVSTAGAAGVDMTAVFRWVFVAAEMFLVADDRRSPDGRAAFARSGDHRISRASAGTSGIAPATQGGPLMSARTSYLLRTTSL